MSGRVRLITGASQLIGLRVNESTWNPHSGVGSGAGRQPGTKTRKKKRNKQRKWSPDRALVTCPKCGTKVSQRRLERHLLKVHNEARAILQEVLNETAKEPEQPVPPVIEVTSTQCPKCDYAGKTFGDLAQHLSREHGFIFDGSPRESQKAPVRSRKLSIPAVFETGHVVEFDPVNRTGRVLARGHYFDFGPDAAMGLRLTKGSRVEIHAHAYHHRSGGAVIHMALAEFAQPEGISDRATCVRRRSSVPASGARPAKPPKKGTDGPTQPGSASERFGTSLQIPMPTQAEDPSSPKQGA